MSTSAGVGLASVALIAACIWAIFWWLGKPSRDHKREVRRQQAAWEAAATTFGFSVRLAKPFAWRFVAALLAERAATLDVLYRSEREYLEWFQVGHLVAAHMTDYRSRLGEVQNELLRVEGDIAVAKQAFWALIGLAQAAGFQSLFPKPAREKLAYTDFLRKESEPAVEATRLQP